MPLDHTSPPSQDSSAAQWDLTGDINVPEDKPGFAETLGASWRLKNTFGAYEASRVQQIGGAALRRVDTDFNPFQSGLLDDYEDNPDDMDRLLKARNLVAFEAIKADIDRERRDRRIRAASDWTIVTDTISGTADWPTLLPGGGFVRAGNAGYSALRSAGSMAAGAMVGTVGQEGALYTLQQTHDLEESAYDIAGSGLLYGLIGVGGAKILSRKQFTEASKALEAGRGHSSHPMADGTMRSNPDPGGSKPVLPPSGATAAPKQFPVPEELPTRSEVAKTIQRKLSAHRLSAQDEPAGRILGPSVETALEGHQARRANFARDLGETYREARQAGSGTGWGAFKEAVARAYRNDGVDPDGNEFVERAVKTLNDNVVGPAVKQMVKLGMVPKDVPESLISRIISGSKVIGRTGVFRDIVAEWASNEISNLIQNVIDPQSDEALPSHSWNRDEASGFHNTADRAAYVDEVVDRIVGNVTGRAPFDGPDWMVPVAHGPLKGRLFDIPDALIDDFLEHDVEVIADTFTRKTAPEIELTRAFGSAGMETAFADLKADYDLKVAQAGSDEERQSLQDEYERMSKTLADFRDGLRGNTRVEQTASVWSSAMRAARAWSYAESRGSGMSVPLADVAHKVAGRGVTGFMKDALPDLVSGTRAARITRQDARDFSTILETVTKARMASLTGLTNPFATKSAAETLANGLDDRFSRGGAINWWNPTMKDALSVYTMNRIAKTVLVTREGATDGAGQDETPTNYGTLSRRQRGYMERLGIDEQMAVRIGGQTRKHGVQEYGIWGLNLAGWEDAGARRVMLDAIAEEVDRGSTRGRGVHMPLWAQSNLGQLILRFKSHVLGAHQGILYSRLSGRPKHLADFLTTGASMGMLTVYLDNVAEGDFEGAERLTEQPDDWISAGLGRCGILPVVISPTAELPEAISR
ncbi:hypothetical protein [uncultured Roseibium sp.]|uniref:hypothetical protein n=1 Tax=uncultured Roseibium sp. TaxID=1936171 RepID=UPI003217B17F